MTRPLLDTVEWLESRLGDLDPGFVQPHQGAVESLGPSKPDGRRSSSSATSSLTGKSSRQPLANWMASKKTLADPACTKERSFLSRPVIAIYGVRDICPHLSIPNLAANLTRARRGQRPLMVRIHSMLIVSNGEAS